MVKLVRRGAGVALAVLLVALPVLAQDSGGDVRQEIEKLKQGQQEILKQLEELKKLLAARPTPPPAPTGPNVKDVVFSLGENPLRGSATAKLTMVEFTDYQ